MHDWFSKTGQGVGSEYRYNFGGGSDGDFARYLLDEQRDDRRRSPAARRAELQDQRRRRISCCRAGFARGRSVDYFSSIATNQTFNTNINDASNSQRSFGGNVVGAWGSYSLNGTLDRTEYFYSQTSSNVDRQLAARHA